MPNPIPVELRERAVAAYENGEGSYAVIAARFAISEDSLMRWVHRHRDSGSCSPFKKGGGNRSKVDIVLLHQILAANPHSTSLEMTREYNRHVEDDMVVSRSAFLRAVYKEQYVFKKNGGVQRSRTGRTSGKHASNGRHGR